MAREGITIPRIKRHLPAPPTPLFLRGGDTSLQRKIIQILRKPKPGDRPTPMALCGFALLLAQNRHLEQAFQAVRKALACIMEDQGRTFSIKLRTRVLRVGCTLALLNDDFRTADKWNRLALALSPKDPENLDQVAGVLVHMNRKKDAEMMYIGSLLLDPAHAPAYRNYAKLVATWGQPAYAHTYFKRSFTSSGFGAREYAKACLGYATFLLEAVERDVPAAERLLRQGLQAVQDAEFSDISADLYFMLGRLYHLYRRELSNAVKYYAQAISLEGDHYFAFMHYACLLSTSRLKSDDPYADLLFRRALSLQRRPDFLQTLLYIRFLTIKMEDYVQAEEELMSAFIRGRGQPVPSVAYAELLGSHPCLSHSYQKALRQTVHVFPADAIALTFVGMAMENEKMLHDALTVSKQSYAPAFYGKGLLASKLDKGRDHALKLHLQGLKLMPDNVPLLRSVAALHLCRYPLEEKNREVQKQVVTSCLTKAVELESSHVPTLLALALVKIRYQDIRAGMAFLRKATKLESSKQEKSRSYRLLGQAYYGQGMRDKAMQAFKCALQAAPEDPLTLCVYAASLAESTTSFELLEQYFLRAFTQKDIPSYCFLLYGSFKITSRDTTAAKEFFLAAAKNKSRPPNCLALYNLGKMAMSEDAFKEMENWFVWALETEPESFLQVAEYLFMLEEVERDYEREKHLYNLARHRRKERSKSTYKAKFEQKWDIMKRVHRYANLRRWYLEKSKMVDTRVPLLPIFMGEAGWEERYLRSSESSGSWPSLFFSAIHRLAPST